jgi:hypothetical protein
MFFFLIKTFCIGMDELIHLERKCSPSVAFAIPFNLVHIEISLIAEYSPKIESKNTFVS